MVRLGHLLLVCLFLPACVSNQYALISAGDVQLDQLQVRSVGTWNRAPEIATPYLHKNSELWTRDGTGLDRLLLLVAVENDTPLFISHLKTLVYPAFKRSMLPNEIVELTEASLVKLYGSETLIESSGLAPQRVGQQKGIRFDLSIKSAESPAFRGRALAFIHENKLYEILYLATEVYYFDKHWEDALALMESASIAPATEI